MGVESSSALAGQGQASSHRAAPQNWLSGFINFLEGGTVGLLVVVVVMSVVVMAVKSGGRRGAPRLSDSLPA